MQLVEASQQQAGDVRSLWIAWHQRQPRDCYQTWESNPAL